MVQILMSHTSLIYSSINFLFYLYFIYVFKKKNYFRKKKLFLLHYFATLLGSALRNKRKSVDAVKGIQEAVVFPTVLCGSPTCVKNAGNESCAWSQMK